MPPKSKRSKKTAPSDPTEDLSSPPTEINPYTVLSVATSATTSEIRTAYRKLALQWHPDKHQDKAEAHTKFQEIAFAYAILSDDARRRRYDQTGRLDETEDGEFDWKEWFGEMWKDVVTGDTIKAFRDEYQGRSRAVWLIVGSEEEIEDVLRAYEEGEGSVGYIHEHIMASSFEDEPRFIKIVNDAIEEDKVEVFARWKKETSSKAVKTRKKAAEKEAKEAEELSKELGMDKPLNGMDERDLGKLIRQRQQGRMDSLLEKLEADARNGSKKGKRKEPTDKEFADAQARVEGRKDKKQKRK
jgi:DnaJ family protein C protein 9